MSLSQEEQQQQQPPRQAAKKQLPPARILKSYYYKDAAASVSSSFSALDAAPAKLGSAAESVYSLSSGSSGSPVSSKSNQHRSASKQAPPLVFSQHSSQPAATHSSKSLAPGAKKSKETKRHDSSPPLAPVQVEASRVKTQAHSSCIDFFNQILNEETLHRLNAQSAHNSLKRNSQSLKVKSTGSLKTPSSDSVAEANLSLLRQSLSSELDTLKKPTKKALSERFTLKRKKQKHLEKNRLRERQQLEDDGDRVDSVPSLSDESRRAVRVDISQPSSDSSISLENLNPVNRSPVKMYSSASATATPVYHGANYYTTPSSRQQQQQQQQQLALLSKKARKHLPFNHGIKNHGNTCFMNCILQCLFHTSPLADFFVTLQFENDMQIIYHQLKQASLGQHAASTASSGFSHFILTKYVYRLLNSLWRNAYNPLYSSDLKQLIGSINPTFAGGNQNDSHEFCIWLLDKLSQELTIKSLAPLPASSKQPAEEPASGNQEETPPPPRSSSSFIEELFQIQFKSSVVCSKCNFKSSKYETDMMLSLPLPQQSQQSPQRSPQIHPGDREPSPTRRIRRSVYVHLLLSNLQSIRLLTAPSHEVPVDQTDPTRYAAAAAAAVAPPSADNSYKSKFYLSDFLTADQDPANLLPSAYNLTAVNHQQTPSAVTTPQNAEYRSGSIHARIAFSAQFTSPSNKKELASLATSPAYCVVNADIGDLRKYTAYTYQVSANDLVFIDLNRVNTLLSDKEPLREHLVKVDAQRTADDAVNDSLCIVELNQLPPKTQQQMPLINIIAINVFHESTSESKRCFPCGMPHVLLINRDCTYSELCKKLLEVQSKYFKDKNFLKYKDLAEKLFTLTLVDSKGKQKLNSGDELPLYAECVERALTENVKSSPNQAEYIKLNIEWRSYDDITNLLKDIDTAKPDLVHRSVHYLSRFDDEHRLTELANESRQHEDAYRQPRSSASASPPNDSVEPGTTTLNDCFELFTQREELTDDNSWMCPKCKKQTNAYKNLCISALPPILIIHLKRFFYKSNTSNFKLTTPVWFPVCSLDMGKYLDKCKNSSGSGSGRGDEVDHHMMANLSVSDEHHTTPKSRSSRPYIYDLFAVCNHKGQNMVNGHYTAFCKNFIDTRWYCYDDANCIPMADMNQLGNVTSNGANSVCTENAYILFYKRRNCMKNEKWWYNFVDRSLYESDEFHRFLNVMDAIERQQHEYQLRFQTSSASRSSNTSHRPVTTAASLVMTNGTNDYVTVNRARKPITVSSEYNYDQENDYGRSNGRYEEPLCQREMNRQAERQLQDELLRGDSNRSRYDARRNYDGTSRDAYAYEGLVVNRYDEQVKPHRLLAKSSESPNTTTPMPRNSSNYQLQASSTSNLTETVNSSSSNSHRPTIETSKSAHNLLATKTPSNDSPPNILVSVDSSQRSTNYMNEFTPSSSSLSSNNESIAQTAPPSYSQIQQAEEQSPRELMNFANETPVQQLFRLNPGQTTTGTSILDYPSDNEYLYNQYVYNQPTIKPRTSLNKPTTATTTTTLPSSNLRYHPVTQHNNNNNIPSRVNNFYGQAAPQFISNYQYQPVTGNQQVGYYSPATTTTTSQTPNHRVLTSSTQNNLLLSSSPATPLNPVNKSAASRYINPGSIETTI